MKIKKRGLIASIVTAFLTLLFAALPTGNANAISIYDDVVRVADQLILKTPMAPRST